MNVIVGLKWPPETTPKASIKPIRLPAIAIADDRSELPRWSPDPTTAIISIAVPTHSAKDRRNSETFGSSSTKHVRDDVVTAPRGATPISPPRRPSSPPVLPG